MQPHFGLASKTADQYTDREVNSSTAATAPRFGAAQQKERTKEKLPTVKFKSRTLATDVIGTVERAEGLAQSFTEISVKAALENALPGEVRNVQVGRTRPPV